MKRLLILVALLSMTIGCANKTKTVNALRSAGYTDIMPGGPAFGGCGEDDTYATKFTARNPAGTVVNGVVCCGLVGKGCTIRF